MGQVDLPEVQPMGNKSTEEYVKYLANIVAILKDEIENILGGRLSSNNIREIAGYNVSQTELKHKSGIVGMSGEDPTNPDAVRYWSGDADKENAPFKVLQKGYMESTSGKIANWDIDQDKLSGPGVLEGGVVRTAAENNQRIELSSGSFKGYTADNLLSGLVFDPNKALDIVDLFLYHMGYKLLEFFDGIDYIAIRAPSGANKMELGGPGAPTYTKGVWDFGSASSVTGIPQSAIDDLISRLNSIENDIDDHEGRIIDLENP